MAQQTSPTQPLANTANGTRQGSAACGRRAASSTWSRPRLSGALLATALTLTPLACTPADREEPESVGAGASGSYNSHASERAATPSPASSPQAGEGITTAMPEQVNKYVGLWVTADNFVKQQLLPDGRYVEARGENERAYTGRYKVTGDHIEYWDDSGFTADGEFRDDVLYHGGMMMRRAAD
jgi:hypothetical protein